jgi:hypothetical protein
MKKYHATMLGWIAAKGVLNEIDVNLVSSDDENMFVAGNLNL